MRWQARCALGIALLLAGCAGKEEPAPAPGSGDAGHDHHAHHGAAPPEADAVPRSEKHAELLQIAERLRNSEEKYFGEVTLRRLEAADTTAMSKEHKAQWLFSVGQQRYKFGRRDEAEALWEKSFETFPSVLTKYMIGVAQLRRGELENCLGHHTAESCVFPLAGGGVHVEKGGAEQALETLVMTWERSPQDLRPRVRWFANLAAMALGRYPAGLDPAVAIPPEKFASDYDIGHFPDVAMALGISRMNLAGGSIVEDFDEDGFLDIVISTANPWGQMLYYKNQGDGTFSDRTEEAGLLGQLGGLNLIHADYDNDGWRDIVVLRGGWMGTFGRIPCSLLRNQGDGTFTDVTNRAGLAVEAYPSQAAAFADYDLDGDLDLFFGNETPPPESGMKYPCELFRNDGDGRFTDVAVEAGVENFKLAKGVAWGDFDDDRDPDLYVSNQFDIDRFYRNEGGGKFTNIAEELGVHEPKYSFPAWFWDYDNDGKIDLFVAGYGGDVGDVARSYLRPEGKFALSALFKNGGGSFRDVAKEAGLGKHALVMGANFGDLDNDGWLDFYLGTGAPEFDALMPNQMYRNDGKGGFQDVTTSGGFGNLQKGHGIAWGDLDNDGDQDIFLESGGIYPYDEYFNSLFQNPGHGNHWVSLELEGVESNRDAIGTRIRVRVRENGGTRDIWRWVWPCGSFGSSSFRQHVGLGQAEAIEVVEVYWPKTDATQTLRGFELDASYRIVESAAAPERVERRKIVLQTGS
jgi:hypothetical protein